MRKYSQISPRFWIGTTGRRIRALGADAQVLAMYLLTAPTSTMTGLYYLPIATAAHETGIPFEGARKALRSLAGVGFCSYDEVDEVVLVPEMARHQVADRLKPGDNRVAGIVNTLEPYRRHRFCADFLQKYAEPFGLPPDIYQGPAEGLASPSQAPSEPLRSQEQDQEQKHEQERASAEASPRRTIPSRAKRDQTSEEPKAQRKRETPPTPPDSAPPPLPFTVRDLGAALARGAGTAFALKSWDNGLAKPVTAVIRSLAEAGRTLEDIEAAGRVVAGWPLSEPLTWAWVAKAGNLTGAVAKAREPSPRSAAQAARQAQFENWSSSDHG